MSRRDLLVVIGALVLAIGVSTVLYVGAMATDPAPSTTAELRTVRPRIFFDFRNTPPPARAIVDAQERVGPLAAIVPLQRNLSDGARDAAGSRPVAAECAWLEPRSRLAEQRADPR